MRSIVEFLAARGRGAILIAAVAGTGLALCASPVHGAEVVASLGVTKPVESGADAQTYGALAVRHHFVPLLMGEIGAAYRSESRYGDQLKVRMWPITASLYLAPVRYLYAGAGVGWYHTTLDYASGVPVADETRQDFGVHVGGGLQVPLSSGVAVDLSGRYVMMRDQQSHLVPEKFDPDFWTTSLGLALRF
jgi:opacity protein-like surface antigen